MPSQALVRRINAGPDVYKFDGVVDHTPLKIVIWLLVGLASLVRVPARGHRYSSLAAPSKLSLQRYYMKPDFGVDRDIVRSFWRSYIRTRTKPFEPA